MNPVITPLYKSKNQRLKNLSLLRAQRKKPLIGFHLLLINIGLLMEKGMKGPLQVNIGIEKMLDIINVQYAHQYYSCIWDLFLLTFRSDHKFQTPTGMASFWTSNSGAVELLDDVHDIKEDKTNITSKLINESHKK